MDSMMASSPSPFLRWVFIAALILVLDLATKYWVVQSYRVGESTVLTSFFNVVRAHNPGAAFSLFADQSGWQRWFLTVLAMVASAFVLWQIKIHSSKGLLSISLASILGGALGNAIDRMARGHVIDFLSIHASGYHFPTFNVADIAITTGVIGVVVHEVLSRRSREHTKTQ
jgi:signal peptidase II